MDEEDGGLNCATDQYEAVENIELSSGPGASNEEMEAHDHSE